MVHRIGAGLGRRVEMHCQLRTYRVETPVLSYPHPIFRNFATYGSDTRVYHPISYEMSSYSTCLRLVSCVELCLYTYGETNISRRPIYTYIVSILASNVTTPLVTSP
jgi:hypothetical protein